MSKGLYERLVENVLDVIISDGIEIAEKNYKKICFDYGVIYQKNRVQKINILIKTGNKQNAT